MKGCKRAAEARSNVVPAGTLLRTGRDFAATVPKNIGFEIELGNHLLTQAAGELGAEEAAAALVAAHHRQFGEQGDGIDESVSEFDRLGFRVYKDHEHAEISSPLVHSATELVLVLREARRIISACAQAAEKEVGPMRVSFNNSNRQGAAWAFHENVLVSRSAFDQWREAAWKPLEQQWVPFLVTSLPIVGTGKTGAENGTRDVAFQFSQRADFIDAVVGVETVTSKSLVNTRDEPLADPQRYARLHVIAWDTSLSEFANWLRFGVSQILLALLEEQVPLPDLALEKPVQAFQAVSRDLKLKQRLRLQNGQRETALGIQRRLAEAVARALETGCAACQVPEAEWIVTKWIETVDDLNACHPRLSRRLDWRAKLDVLERARELGTTDRQRLRMVDLHYAELGGLFEKLERIGGVDRLEDFLPARSLAVRRPHIVAREQVRALLVGRFGRHLDRVDWDYAVGRDKADRRWLIRLDDPLDSRELLNVVTDAKDWDSCVEGLIRTASAQAVANNSAAVCDGRPERRGIIVLT